MRPEEREAMAEARQAGLEAHMRYFGQDIPKGGAIAFLDGLDAFLAKLSETHAIVPREPTEAMVRALKEWVEDRCDGQGYAHPDVWGDAYRAMLAATTPPPSTTPATQSD